MLNFKTASRTSDELKADKQALDEMFASVKGTNGKMNRKAVQKLDADRYEIAQLVIQLINDTALLTDPTPFLVEAVDGDIRNDYIWQQPNSALRVVSRSNGTKPLSQRLTFKEFAIATSGREVACEIPLEEIASGRITASMVTDATAEAINRYKIGAVLDGLDAGVTSGADRTGVAGYTLRYTGFTAANLDKALDGLMDEGEAPTIFGRHVTLAPAIRGFAGYSQDTLRELEVRGMIGVYHNAPIVTLKDKQQRVTGTHVANKNRVWIASGTKGAKYMTKDVSYLDWAMVDPRSATFGVGTRLEDGLLVWDPYQYRIIEVA